MSETIIGGSLVVGLELLADGTSGDGLVRYQKTTVLVRPLSSAGQARARAYVR
jgi:hypothetical protein